MSNLVESGTKEEVAHLRSKNRFYVAGWVANTSGNAAIEKQHEDYLSGYGDSYANYESLAAQYDQFYS